MPNRTSHRRLGPVLGRLLLPLLVLLGATTAASAQPGDAVDVTIQASDSTVAPGGWVVLAVTLSHQEGWHSHTHDPQIPESWGGFYAIPTTIDLKEAGGGSPGKVQWPEEHTVLIDLMATGTPEPYAVYEGEAVAFVPVKLPDDASGEITISLDVGFQVCDDSTCLPPDTRTVQAVVTADPAGATEPTLTGVFAAFDASVLGEALEAGPVQSGGAGVAQAVRPKFLGFIPLPASGGIAGVLVLAGLGVLGGFILNLTPCVLPVIPIKVLTISKHAGSPGRSLYLGLWMALGVTAFWVGIGLPVALVTSITDPSRVFGIWWVTLGIGLVIGAMGVGIMGAFNINLPQKVYFINPKADTAGGSFAFGVMTAVLGLPCFGFVAGALLAGAATLPASVIMVIFTSLGVGMAAPYLVLSAKPSLIEKIPRTGPASELVKQVMGLLLLAAAAYFVGAGVLALLKGDPVRAASLPWWAKAWHWWLIALFASAAGGWLIFRTFAITKRVGARSVFSVIGLVFAALAIFIGANRTLKVLHDFWIPYTEELYQQSLAEGKVVVLDFTADWCLNCQALKAAVLDPDPVKSQLLRPEIVPLVADCTTLKGPAWDKLAELGQAGIPLLVIDGPGLSEPWLSNAYTSGMVMDALAQAEGARETASR